ncbi:Trypsin domain containing protein [Trichuris trichiura]|uniref:Trypsin domain containing protein n=1 Tax=Trichuris trichiura TaxID=36087 RepID=A0A077ZA67_TRITR|nr:Trypsin domain containing protein [Trichuris trichiura]
MALLVHKGGDVCSGVLIPTSKRNSSFGVVTSSSCQSKGDIGEWVVLTGIGPNGQMDGPYSRISKATYSLPVTNYTQEDVAFVFFYPEVSFNENVMPVCLPSRSKPPSSSKCILTGYEVERRQTGKSNYNVLIEGVSRARLREMALSASAIAVHSKERIRRLHLKDKSNKTDVVHSIGSPLVCNHGGLWTLYGTYIPSLSGSKDSVFTDFFDGASVAALPHPQPTSPKKNSTKIPHVTIPPIPQIPLEPANYYNGSKDVAENAIYKKNLKENDTFYWAVTGAEDLFDFNGAIIIAATAKDTNCPTRNKGATKPKKEQERRYYGPLDVVAYGIYENNLKKNHNFYWRVTATNVTEVRNGTRIIKVKAKETTCPIWVDVVYSTQCPIDRNGHKFLCFVQYRPGEIAVEKNGTVCEGEAEAKTKADKDPNQYDSFDIAANAIHRRNLKIGDPFYWRVTEALEILLSSKKGRLIKITAEETTCSTGRTVPVTYVYTSACPIYDGAKKFECFVYYDTTSEAIPQISTACLLYKEIMNNVARIVLKDKKA